ncbi:MAG: hypothetical protein ACQSGP_02310 [Frankia sp.]
MSALDWFFSLVLIILYVAFIFTIAVVTFRKGYLALGIIGIFLPILWLVGAVLPAKPGSSYAIEHSARARV